MSPCTAKLSAFRSKQAGKYVYVPQLIIPGYIGSAMLTRNNRVKPKSLFAQASAKKLEGTTTAATGGSNMAPAATTVTANGGLFGVAKKD